MTDPTNSEQHDLAVVIYKRLLNRQVEWDRSEELAHGRPPTEEDSQAWIEEQIAAEMVAYATERTRRGDPYLSDAAEEALGDQIRVRLSPMQTIGRLLENPELENLLGNDFMTTWLVLTGGRKVRGPALADSEEEFIDLLRMIGTRYGRSERRFDAAHPTLDVQLPGGHRLNALMEISGSVCVSIRRHGHIEVSLEDLISFGTLDEGLAEFLAAAVAGPEPANVLISGGTNSGKTTLLRALIDVIAQTAPDTRLITIEDNLELMLKAHPKLLDVIELEAREANVEGQGEFTMADCLRNALRMSPERLLVGECRGAEVIDMLNAMSTGNDGSMGTIHAQSAYTTVDRVVQYGHMAALPEEATLSILRGAVNLIVHIKRLPDGSRVITQVLEVTGVRTDSGGVQTLELWAPDTDGRAQRTGVVPTPRMATILAASGFEVGGGW